MSHWDDIQKKTKKLVDEAVNLIKEGACDAEFIAGKTADAAKLQATITRNNIEKHRIVYRLGNEVFEKISRAPATSLDLSKRMKDLINRAKDLDLESQTAEKDLKKFTIVSKRKAAPKGGASKTGKRH